MSISAPAKKMIIIIAIATAAIMAVGAALYLALGSLPSGEALPFAIGVLLTSSLNALKVYLLDRTVKRALDMEDAKSGKSYMTFQYMLRYLLTGAVLVVAALTPFINLIGAIVGIFTMQIGAYSVKFMKIE